MYLPFNVKTDYYLLHSLIKVKDLINFCVSNNINICCICDNNLAASMEFYYLAKKNNIKPIIGLEVLYNNNKIYLYAEDFSGYQNLLKINTFIQKENLTETTLIKYSNKVSCVLPLESSNLFYEFSFFDNLFIGYKNNGEKQNALILTSNVILNNDIKTFSEKDKNYLGYLNEMGGLNNLNVETHLSELTADEVKEFDCFISNIDLTFDSCKKYIPVFDKSKDSFFHLSMLANRGLSLRLGDYITDDYKKRLDYELNVIREMGFVDYFLIVYDYVLYAKKNNILVGPGRGSAAGSLISYCTGITDVDPLKYDLLFERFLNKERVSMPDIDIDFDANRKDEVINYVKSKYGYENVAIGLTYNTFKTKLVLRDVAKILKIDNVLLEQFLKVINKDLNLKDNLNIVDVNKFLNSYAEIKNLYKICMKLEGLKKNASTHAAGVVICSENLDNIIPVKVVSDGLVTGITMDYLENLGILKMDFLALKNLSTIDAILKVIGKNELKNINYEDEKVIKLFHDAKTEGIFQYETFAMKTLLEKLKPKNFEDIIAAVALVRPGPADFLDDYIKNRDNKAHIKYDDPRLEDILKETYGVILYQEQIIKIFVSLANFSLAEADLIRRAISKKKASEIALYKEKFILGATNNGITLEKANFLFDKIARFADFGFNKAHSVSYAMIGFQMAYLKVYYENLFTGEMLKDTKDKKVTENFLIGLKNDGVKIIKPDINYSKEEFYFKENQIILPFSMIKGISSEVSKNIIENRPYNDFFNFYIKNKNIKEEELKTLIYANALRSLKCNMKTLISNISLVKNYVELGGSLSKPILKMDSEYDKNFIMAKEYELFGFYLGNHPSSIYKSDKIKKIVNIEKYLFQNVMVAVIIEKISQIKTKKGDDMAFISVSDETGKLDLVIFSDKINLLEKTDIGNLIFVSGKISKNQDKIRLVVSDINIESRK